MVPRTSFVPANQVGHAPHALKSNFSTSPALACGIRGSLTVSFARRRRLLLQNRLIGSMHVAANLDGEHGSLVGP